MKEESLDLELTFKFILLILLCLILSFILMFSSYDTVHAAGEELIGSYLQVGSREYDLERQYYNYPVVFDGNYRNPEIDYFVFQMRSLTDDEKAIVEECEPNYGNYGELGIWHTDIGAPFVALDIFSFEYISDVYTGDYRHDFYFVNESGTLQFYSPPVTYLPGSGDYDLELYLIRRFILPNMSYPGYAPTRGGTFSSNQYRQDLYNNYIMNFNPSGSRFSTESYYNSGRSMPLYYIGADFQQPFSSNFDMSIIYEYEYYDGTNLYYKNIKFGQNFMIIGSEFSSDWYSEGLLYSDFDYPFNLYIKSGVFNYDFMSDYLYYDYHKIKNANNEAQNGWLKIPISDSNGQIVRCQVYNTEEHQFLIPDKIHYNPTTNISIWSTFIVLQPITEETNPFVVNVTTDWSSFSQFFSLVGSAFHGIGNILAIDLFGMSLAFWVFAPLVLSIILSLIAILRKR